MKIWVRVPGSSGNLGSGFDVAAAALAAYFELEIEVVPISKGDVLDKNNLVIATALPILKKSYPKSGFKFRMKNGIPLARGMGSSAAARLAAISAAKLLGHHGEPGEEEFNAAAKLEGHPDNVAASFHGGFTLAWPSHNSSWFTSRYSIANNLLAVICIPDFKLPTEKARKVLPASIPREDAVYNLERMAALVSAFATGNFDQLKLGMQDRLHQPYRWKLIPGLYRVIEAAMRKDAYGACLSGAGPSVLAVSDTKKDSESIGESMKAAFSKSGVSSQYQILHFDNSGIISA